VVGESSVKRLALGRNGKASGADEGLGDGMSGHTHGDGGQAGGDYVGDISRQTRRLALLSRPAECVCPTRDLVSTRVSGPGQNFVARRSAFRGQFVANDCAISIEATWTMSGLVGVCV